MMDNVPPVSIECSVPTGLENVAAEDIRQHHTVTDISRGCVQLQVAIADVTRIQELKCVDNCRVIVKKFEKFFYPSKEEDCLHSIRHLVLDVPWQPAIQAWKKYSGYLSEVSSLPVGDFDVDRILTSGWEKPKLPKKKESSKEGSAGRERKSSGEQTSLHDSSTETNSATPQLHDSSTETKSPTSSLHDSSTETKSATSSHSPRESTTVQPTEIDTQASEVCAEDGNSSPSESPSNMKSTRSDQRTDSSPDQHTGPPRFRVTCLRKAKQLPFDSTTAAAHFGAAIQDYFGWTVDLDNFDIEVILLIRPSELCVSISLTKDSLHRRTITKFRGTVLRTTICYGLLRLCKIQPGDKVCDPMCGAGTIPIEGVLGWPQAKFLCGDIDEEAVGASQLNIQALKLSSQLEATVWDSTDLPLPSNDLDVIVTDMPFGRRCGSFEDNRRLYPLLLKEWGRVAKTGVARACLLTADKRTMMKAVGASRLWNRKVTYSVNVGGLEAGVWLLLRNNTNWGEQQLKSSRKRKVGEDTADAAE